MRIRTSIHPGGFSSLSFLGHLTALLLTIAGCQGIYMSLKNRAPAHFTTAEFIAEKPDAQWVVLEDAEVSLAEAAYKAWMGNLSEVFIPVRARGQSTTEPIHILLSTDDPAVISALKKLRDYGGTKEKTVAAAARHSERLFMERTLPGLIRYGLISDIITRFRLMRLDLPLADDFVILDDGERPTAYLPVAMVAGALLIWFFMLCDSIRIAEWHWRHRKHRRISR
ncbi:hypothetical protein [Prosthecobacter sp.]|uniref:hypothetical protein n=1 Tax=Prosthecobacter sp. TaxID=1965333 RepID=UPI0037840726